MDLLFFLTINLLLLSIFFGIIVDSFANYRDEINKKQDRIQNHCFICGRSYMDVEINEDIEDHKKRHDIWLYFNFLLYLDWKNP